MIQLKNSAQLKDMREAGRITAQALLVAEEAIREGVSTYEIDMKLRSFIEKCGAVSICASFAWISISSIGILPFVVFKISLRLL